MSMVSPSSAKKVKKQLFLNIGNQGDQQFIREITMPPSQVPRSNLVRNEEEKNDRIDLPDGLR